MTTINLDDMQRDFLAYLRHVRAGESFLIVEVGRPIAELKPVESVRSQTRPFGLCAGEFVVPDDFDNPLPEALMRDFEGA